MHVQAEHDSRSSRNRPGAPTSGPETWVDLHGDYLYRYALMRLRDEAQAEEIVQETLLAALESYHRFTGQSSERTWLCGILKHKILDHFRAVSRLTSFDTLDGVPAEPDDVFMHTGEWAEHFDPQLGPVEWRGDPATLLEQNEFRHALNRCLMKLPERLAVVFTLREMEELNSDEVCKVLSISATNLWVMLHRARAHLRKCIEYNWFRRA